MALALAACASSAPPDRESHAASSAARVETTPSRAMPPAPSPSRDPAGAANAPIPVDAETIDRPKSRWVAASWADLPGWRADRVAEAVPALLRGCERPAPAWAALCADARRDALDLVADDATARAFFETRTRPWRIEAADGSATGLLTGYFEPLLEASRTPRPGFRVPLHAQPPELAAGKPGWTRRDLETRADGKRLLRGRELAWLRDPLDALLIQIQGSGRIAFLAEPGRPAQTVRFAYAGHNGEPYRSVGRWLIEQGELSLEQASWPAIRAWARRHPGRVDELLWANPRVVFFREEPLPDPALGPKGAQGVPLTPGRSIAVDPGSIGYGTPVFVDSTEPLATTPLRRLVLAQDTGTAIAGAVRADWFWGWGEKAEAQAGRMKQPLRMWALWPVASRP